MLVFGPVWLAVELLKLSLQFPKAMLSLLIVAAAVGLANEAIEMIEVAWPWLAGATVAAIALVIGVRAANLEASTQDRTAAASRAQTSLVLLELECPRCHHNVPFRVGSGLSRRSLYCSNCGNWTELNPEVIDLISATSEDGAEYLSGLKARMAEPWGAAEL